MKFFQIVARLLHSSYMTRVLEGFMSKRLTAKDVADFFCPTDKQQAFLRDSETRGLAVRATRNGSKAFVLDTFLHGKNIRLTIGDVRTWPLDGPAGVPRNARAEARRLQSLIDQGIDPRALAIEQKAKANAAKAQAEADRLKEVGKAITVQEAWAKYIAARTPKWGERSLRDHQKLSQVGGVAAKRGKRLTKPGSLAALMPLRLSEVTAETVRAWLTDEVVSRPTQASLAYRLLRAFLNWCTDQPCYMDFVSADACNNRIAKDILPRPAAKKDCLQYEQLPAWFAAVRQIPNPVISAYLQGLLLTGARRQELLGLRWSDVDFKWKKLTIRDKIEAERTIPLTPYFESLLLLLKCRNETPPPASRILSGKRIENDLIAWQPSPWVFCSARSKSGRLTEPSIQHRRAVATAGLDGMTLHGLRRSFGTLAEWVECPVGVAAQIMGHKPSAIAEKHYIVRPLDMLRRWHTCIETWIVKQATTPFGDSQEQNASLHAA